MSILFLINAIALIFSEFVHHWTTFIDTAYIYLWTGLILLTISPILLYKFAILCPLDEGIIINEYAALMNE